MSKISLPRDLKPFAKVAEAAGWTFSKTGTNHIKWTPPVGQPLFTPSTSDSRRLVANTRSDLRRRGLEV